MSCLRLIPAIYGIVMVIVITCIFTRAFTDIRTNLIDQLCSFNYPRTYVELYFLILIDSLLFIICSSICRIKSFRLIFILFQLFIYSYSLSKFLVFYEWKNVRNTISPYQFDRFDYLAMAFSPLLALGGIFIWILSFRINSNEQIEPERQRLINETPTRSYTEETEPLLVQKEDKNLKVQIKETSGSWWRIIKLGKQEWKLYIAGFFFLLIAALSKTLISKPNQSNRILSSSRNVSTFFLWSYHQFGC